MHEIKFWLRLEELTALPRPLDGFWRKGRKRRKERRKGREEVKGRKGMS